MACGSSPQLQGHMVHQVVSVVRDKLLQGAVGGVSHMIVT